MRDKFMRILRTPKIIVWPDRKTILYNCLTVLLVATAITAAAFVLDMAFSNAVQIILKLLNSTTA